MKARSVIAGLLVVLVPLALSLLTVDAARAALAPVPMVMAASSPMNGCHEPPMPAKAPDCNPACPLVCAPIVAVGSGLAAPIRPYARLHYDQALPGLEGRALEPELPPPRRVQSTD